ncbi:MAG TPA: FAD-linked oxidase C-terminal domain-containing protein [Steroidobacteraceae bacterium]
MNALPADRQNALTQLKALLGERLSTSQSVRNQHGTDIAHPAAQPPDAVAYPLTTAEVAAIVRICHDSGTPVIAFGVGSSLEGHVLAPHGGVCIDLGRMDQVVAVNERDLDVTVQPGVTRESLNAHLRDTGLFFPIDPGANATLGGMAATRASGTNAVRYGTMRENVLALEVVLADGSVIHTGTRARKSAAGYDLTRLFVGSEGTLGIITQLTLRVYGIPEAMSAAVCAFDDLRGAVETVIETIQLGVPVARIELLDEMMIRAVNQYSKLSLRELPTLFLEFHGSQAGVEEQATTVSAIAQEHGGQGFEWALKPAERARLWKARHDAAWAALAMRPGSTSVATDVCVPISRLADCILETRRDVEAMQAWAPIVGHVGDGNFHLVLLVDRSDPADIELAERLNDRLVHRALGMGGTCTGEHGIGVGKQQFLIEEAGAQGVALMRQIKQTLDPRGILNPGKIFASGS